MKILHIVAGLEESNGMANTARQFAGEERAQGHESTVTNDLSALDATADVVCLHGAWLPILWRAAKRTKRHNIKVETYENDFKNTQPNRGSPYDGRLRQPNKAHRTSPSLL